MNSKSPNPLLPAYLVVGEDYLKRDRVIEKMHIRLEKAGDLSFNSDTFNGSQDDADLIVSACKTLPFASEKRLVTVKDAHKMPKGAQAKVVEYLKNPLDTTVLLLVADKLQKNNAMYKSVASLAPYALIDCTPPTKRELPSIVVKMAKSHGIALTQDAALELIGLIGEDTIHIDAELEKLALSHFEDRPLNANDVKGMVARISEAKPWELTDAFGRRDLKRCLEVIALMPSFSPHAMLHQCVGRLRDAMHAQHMVKVSSNASSALASEMKMQEFRVRPFIEAGRRWSSEQLCRALESSLDTERKMKSGTDPDAAFKDWLIASLTK